MSSDAQSCQVEVLASSTIELFCPLAKRIPSLESKVVGHQSVRSKEQEANIFFYWITRAEPISISII